MNKAGSEGGASICDSEFNMNSEFANPQALSKGLKERSINASWILAEGAKIARP